MNGHSASGSHQGVLTLLLGSLLYPTDFTDLFRIHRIKLEIKTHRRGASLKRHKITQKSTAQRVMPETAV